MNTYISMLRGINVSGQKKILMPELRRLYESLKLDRVRSYVQSGNVVFDSPESDTATLAASIEAGIEAMFGFSVAVFVRDALDFHRLREGNPFLPREGIDPTKLYVTFLYHPPAASNLSSLKNPATDGDEFVVGEREVFIFCPNGYGRTKLSNQFFERKLGVPATTRNWKTVNALYQLATAP